MNTPIESVSADHSRKLPAVVSGLIFILATAMAAGLSADEPAGTSDERSVETERFMRVRRSEEGEVLALETAIARYTSITGGTKTIVDLVGAIHIADHAYYTGLNRRFRDYDAVLYELVAPDAGAVPAPGEPSGSPVTAMQVGMKNLLELQFQLDAVDYHRPNFIHADLTTTEFSDSMSARGESVMQMFFRLLGQSIAMQTPDPTRSNDLRLFAALFSQDRPRQLKRMMAGEFERSLSMPSPLDGPNGSTIITVRNQRAMDVLDKQLKLGKRHIAIFYGAAHLPDMETRLKERFGLRRDSTSWLAAWDIP